MFDHLLFPLVIAVAIGFGVGRRRSPDGYLLWWPPSTWRAPSWEAVRLGLVGLTAAVTASFAPGWVVLLFLAVGLAVSWLRRRRQERS